MQQILRDKFTKKSKDLDEEDYNSKRIERETDLFCFDNTGETIRVLRIYVLFSFSVGIRKILEAKLRMSDSQYNRLLETLSTPSDYTYAQTMMDEIIYQLAKLMFNQGLFIGKYRSRVSFERRNKQWSM